MIRVVAKPEYAAFDVEVRRRGQQFLARCPQPSAKQFRSRNYWTNARKELHAAYGGLCAYTSRHLVDTGSIDHFRPKSKYPHLAYEWDNYRLCRPGMNARKGNSEDVVDPFGVQSGWFELEMPTCLIKPGEDVTGHIRTAVMSTIDILQLNDDDGLVHERWQWLVDLADGEISLKYVERDYPFLALEVKRQGVYKSLKRIFSRP